MFQFRNNKIKNDEQKFSVPYYGNELIRASTITKGDLLEYYFEDGKTLYEIFMRGVQISGDQPCIGWRLGPGFPYIWISYNEVLKRAKFVGSGLILLGANPNPLQLIGIMAPNCVEWILVEQACNCYSMVTVPFMEALTDDSITHIVEMCNLKIIVVDSVKKAKRLLSLVMNMHIFLDVIVVMESLRQEIVNLGNDYKVKVVEFSQLEKKGKIYNQKLVEPKPEDLHTIAFTSGATGTPKGVMLTHRNFAVCISNIYALGKSMNTTFKSSDTYLSYAPLSYTIETLMDAALFAVGGKIGFYSGNKKTLLADIQELRPTLLPCPAHLVKHIYELVITKTSKSAFKKYLFYSGLKAKLKLLSRGIITKTSFWDYFQFRQIRNMFGGKIKICITGGPLATQESFNFLKCVLGVNIIAGYGLIETTNLITFSHPLDMCLESAGPPVPSVLVKLVDVVEQKYYTKDGYGEICVKGGNVFSGYFNDLPLTNAVLDDEGWFRTGDIGTWLSNGSLKIVDQRKSIFALLNGKQIAPEKIESIFEQIPVIYQTFVYGDSCHDAIVAVVVPDREIFKSWCTKKLIFGDYDSLIEDPKVNELIFDNILSFAKFKGLESWEMPQSIYVHSDYFTIENGLLDNNKKIKRYNAYINFKSEIENMFR